MKLIKSSNAKEIIKYKSSFPGRSLFTLPPWDYECHGADKPFTGYHHHDVSLSLAYWRYLRWHVIDSVGFRHVPALLFSLNVWTFHRSCQLVYTLIVAQPYAVNYWWTNGMSDKVWSSQTLICMSHQLSFLLQSLAIAHHHPHEQTHYTSTCLTDGGSVRL